MKLTNVLLPIPSHRLDTFKNLKARYESPMPEIEGANESIGTLGTIGFLICLVQIYLFRTSVLMKKLAVLQITAVLLGTVGGFGSLFALLCSPMIRSYNRISIFVAFFSLAALALTVDSLRRWVLRQAELGGLNKNVTKLSLFFGALLILGLGVLDQTSPEMRIRSNPQGIESDRDFIRRIEGKSNPGDMILQLPYFPFPENGPMLRMEDYSHFRAYLHSKTLKWSYGTMRGRPEDRVMQDLGSYPPDITKIREVGFSGIYIDQYGYPDNALMLEERLSHQLNESPLVSQDERLSFFSLRQ